MSSEQQPAVVRGWAVKRSDGSFVLSTIYTTEVDTIRAYVDPSRSFSQAATEGIWSRMVLHGTSVVPVKIEELTAEQAEQEEKDAR